MMKKIFTIAILALTLGSVISTAEASESIELIDVTPQVEITTDGNMIHVTGATGQTMYIYNLAGVCVKTIKIEGGDKRVDPNLTKGCYIVKVGKTARKITIK